MPNWVIALLSFLVSSGIGWFVAKAAVKEAMKEDIQRLEGLITANQKAHTEALEKAVENIEHSVSEIKKDFEKEAEKLHKRINAVEQNYVTCAYCSMQSENNNKLLYSIDQRMNTLVDHLLK